MKPNIVKDKSFDFALKIIETNKTIIEKKHEYVLSKQIIRSGTAIGALIREAEHAESRKDFIHKLSIALKETNETLYWLDLQHQSNYLENIPFKNLNEQCLELLKLLISIINSSKRNL